MGAVTGINYAHHTFSPWWGCAVVSAGCQRCYASELAQRFKGRGYHGPAWWRPIAESTWRQPESWNRAAAKAGERRRVLVSMTDWLLEGIEVVFNAALQEERERFCRLVEATPYLDWLLLTKRPEAWRRLVPASWQTAFPANVWAGVTVERADCLSRLPHLLDMPARVRWVSYEPALGFIPWDQHLARIDWMVAGGESGPQCRPFDLRWGAGAQVACRNAGVAFWFKQLGGYPNPCDLLDQLPAQQRVRELPTTQGA